MKIDIGQIGMNNSTEKQKLNEIAKKLGKNFDIDMVKEIFQLTQFISTKPDLEFKIGDVVFDRKNGEFGIILFKKPRDIKKDEIKKEHLTNKHIAGNRIDSTVFVVLTLSKQEADPENLQFRIRYTSHAFLQHISGVDNLINFDKTSDLNNFCNNQCILACSEECALYKYSLKTNTDNHEE